MIIIEETINEILYFSVYKDSERIYLGKDIDDASQFISSYVNNEE